jgi:two-component system phosphate regulon sensor histidine kinase PhoR
MPDSVQLSIDREDLQRFADAIKSHIQTLLKDWRVQVRRLPAARNLDVPTLDDHIPALFDELMSALLAGETQSVLDLHLQDSPKVHGTLRLRAGFDIVEVVAEYNILRELLHNLAVNSDIDMSRRLALILNRVIDRAIGLAVDSYAKDRAIEVQQRREEHIAFLIHDLRTPLSAMTTAGSVLDKTLPAEAKTGPIQAMIDIVSRNAGRLKALIQVATNEQNNVMMGTLSDRSIERREFDLWALVEELIYDMRPLEQHPVQILNLVPHDFAVHADALLLAQVFQNLLSNAIRYTTKGQIVVSAEKSATGARCWVKDTGSGIPQNRLERIFEKLETDPTRRGGLGLGLPIVEGIVKGHGGQVLVESEIGRGTTFSFTLPEK